MSSSGMAGRAIGVASRAARHRGAPLVAALAVVALLAGVALLYPGAYEGVTGSRAATGDDFGAQEFVAPGVPGDREDAATLGSLPLAVPAMETEADGAMQASAFAPSGFSGAGGAADLLGRDIIRSGSMDLEVESVGSAFERVSAIATAAGGFVADSAFFGREDQQSAHMTLRIPAGRFDSVVSELGAIAAEVVAVSTSSQDVTGELTDLQSQLRKLRAVESQYLQLLDRTSNIGEVLQVQDRLNQTRSEIDRTEGRIQLLERLSDLSTLSVSLRPVAAAAQVTDGGPLAAAQAAWEASLATLNAVAIVAVAVTVYSWWLLPLLAAAVLVGRRAMQLRAGGRASQATE